MLKWSEGSSQVRWTYTVLESHDLQYERTLHKAMLQNACFGHLTFTKVFLSLRCSIYGMLASVLKIALLVFH